MELIPASKVAQILGKEPRYVAEKLVHKEGFPVAYRILGGQRQWNELEIRQWLETLLGTKYLVISILTRLFPRISHFTTNLLLIVLLPTSAIIAD